MLRHYDEVGLLRADRAETNGYRSYHPSQVVRMHRILALKDLGFTLVQVGRIVEEDVSLEELRGMLRLREADLSTEISAATQRLNRVRFQLQRLEQEKIMTTTEVTIKAIEPLDVIEMSATVPDFGPDSIGPVLQPMYPALFERIAKHGLNVTGTPIAYYEEPVDGSGVVVHAAVPVAGGPTRLDGFEQAACLVHHGSMETIDSSYATLIEWISVHGLRTIGYSREVYLDCPENTDDWVTELQFPVTTA